MNPGICYFYEYKNNKKLRNTGFLKTVKQYQTCLLNINIRGIPVNSGESIELYAFFVQDFDFMSKNVGQISCGDKNISARLAIPEASLPGNKALENLDGFFLKTDNGQYHAALLNNGSFDTSRIVNWQSGQVHAKRADIAEESQRTAFESPITAENHTMPNVVKSAGETKVPPMAENRSAAETNGTPSETEKVPVFGYAARSGFKTAWVFESDPKKVTSPDSAAQAPYSQSSPGKNPVTADDFTGSMAPVSAVDSTSFADSIRSDTSTDSAEPAASADSAYSADCAETAYFSSRPGTVAADNTSGPAAHSNAGDFTDTADYADPAGSVRAAYSSPPDFPDGVSAAGSAASDSFADADDYAVPANSADFTDTNADAGSTAPDSFAGADSSADTANYADFTDTAAAFIPAASDSLADDGGPADTANYADSSGTAGSAAPDSFVAAAGSKDAGACTAASDSCSPVSKAPDSAPAVSARKIQRCELSVLPRRCWNLANNSFLMHGYHNYHHLLLVEDDGHFWVGVPGIYAPREARAAEFFGFPQFTRSYTDLMNLEEDERNLKEDFGYWCRFIH